MICIKRINTVVLSDHVEHIVQTLPRNMYSGHIEGLPIDISIQTIGEDLAELPRGEQGRSQNYFLSVLTRTIVVVVLCCHLYLGDG